MQTIRISARVTKEFHARLLDFAQRHGMTLAEAIRFLIPAALDGEETPYFRAVFAAYENILRVMARASFDALQAAMREVGGQIFAHLAGDENAE